MVWLGIDLGDARVGLALSDPGITLAHPAGNIQVYGDSFRALDEVVDVIEGAQYLLKIRLDKPVDGETSTLVPFVDQLVPDIDLENGYLTLDPPGGLIPGW